MSEENQTPKSNIQTPRPKPLFKHQFGGGGAVNSKVGFYVEGKKLGKSDFASGSSLSSLNYQCRF